MAAGALVHVGSKLPRLAGLFPNLLRPAARYVTANPIRSLAGVGGVRGFLNDGFGGILPGAVSGGLWGVGLKGPLGNAPIGGLTRQGIKMGLNPGLARNVASVLPAAGALSLAGFGPGGGGNEVSSGGQRVGGLVSNQLAGRGDPNSGDVLGSGNLPPGTIDRMVGPEGNYWYRLDPAGVPFGDRLGRQLDARANSNVMNILGDTTFAQTERKEKADLARQAAAKQLKENIEMARTMSEASQESGLNMAEASNQAVANAMQNRNNFRYF